MTGVRATACNDWCAGDENCNPDEGIHVSAPYVATEGGPIADKDTPYGATDITYTVGIHRLDRHAQIALQLRVMRLDNPLGWFAPTEVNDLLPVLGMTPARARHISRLLADAADEVDRLHAGAQ